VKDERIRSLARIWLDLGLHDEMEASLVATIKRALAERDAEIVAWAEAQGRHGALIAFLKGADDAG
jgi:hypothetical protein